MENEKWSMSSMNSEVIHGLGRRKVEVVPVAPRQAKTLRHNTTKQQTSLVLAHTIDITSLGTCLVPFLY